MQLFGATLSTCLFLNASAFADMLESEKYLSKYLDECPWIGLIADKVTVGSITISEVGIRDGNKFVCVAPGEILEGSLKYRVKSDDLDALHFYHLIIGIKNEEAQDCVSHNLGLWDSKGHGHFTLTAPKEPGIYEVRFLFTDGLDCSRAHDMWNSGEEEPSAATTIGVIIVE